MIDPIAMRDGAVGFAVQSSDPALYLPAGVYKITSDGQLVLLAGIPPRERQHASDDQPRYGRVIWSPDGSAFLYYEPLSEPAEPPYRVLLLGLADGSTVWDLNPVLGDARSFQWEP
jgi:hypothetical protein